MDDFSARERKLERERQARIAAKKREQEQEAAAAQRYAEQQLQQREALAKRRAEREAEEEKRAEAQRADARLTGGLTWRRTYRCVTEPRTATASFDSSLSELTSACHPGRDGADARARAGRRRRRRQGRPDGSALLATGGAGVQLRLGDGDDAGALDSRRPTATSACRRRPC